MKLSDFFIRGRQFFGFLIPGVMWVAWVALLFFKTNPLSVIEQGESPTLRAITLLALGYIIGFSMQTLLFPLIADCLKRKLDTPDDVKKIEEQIGRIMEAKLPGGETSLCVPRGRLSRLCKLYVLENSTELRNTLLEKEADINFMVANIVPGPLLAFSWFKYKGYGPEVLTGVAILAVGIVAFLMWRLKHYLRREREDWYETFMVLHLGEKRGDKKGDGQTD